MNNPVPRAFKTFFWVKILKFFDSDPGSGMEKIRIRDKHPGSATLVVRVIFLRCWIRIRIRNLDPEPVVDLEARYGGTF